MKTLPLSEARDKLSGLVDEAVSTHEIITITRHARPAAVLMSVDDLESLHETLYWLSKPGIRESVADAEREYSANTTTSGEDLRVPVSITAAPAARERRIRVCGSR